MPTRADRSRTITRERVLEVSGTLFAERGYRATSMRDIADALGIRASSIYNHVESKQNILVAIMNAALDRAAAALDAALAGSDDVADQLRRATESLVLDFLRNPTEVTVTNNEVRSLEPANRDAIIAKRDAYAARVRKIVEAGCRQGRFELPAPQLATFAILEMGNGAKSWFKPGGRYTDVYVARAYGEYALRLVGGSSTVVRRRPAPVTR